MTNYNKVAYLLDKIFKNIHNQTSYILICLLYIIQKNLSFLS